MTYQALRTALTGCRTIDSTNASVNVCLAARAANGTIPTLHRLQLTDELAEGFLTLATDTLRRLDSDVSNVNVALETYDAATPQDKHEVEVHIPSAGSTPHAVVAALDDFPQLPVFDGTGATVNKLIFYVVAIQRPGQSPIYLFRKYSKTKELGRSRKLVTLFSGGTFDKITEPVFIFDELIDAMWVEGHMVIFNKDNYQRIFQFFTEVLVHAQSTLDQIKAAIPIENAGQFEQDCKGNPVILIKLRGIASRNYLSNLTLASLEAKIQARSLPIAINGTGANRKLVYDPQQKWKFLRLIDDGFLSSDMTGTHYEVTGKRTQ
ncbi:Kiwa anti-phage protein KwaB-like domain-containing protein [Microvirga sp. VF16]|uniref:Kiwa anti-phage protein KwaB-like domain-containing protein n=1 Tax=Microvirga sp. VF16 TaxID=2807101 RepID=UPI00193EC0B1|nr:Kiwa anti-phage protein KwaB-like domain-containing protein [Microvirga sp. VF16]QRM34786.1 DUF4868 domain-containing protein [Microvirga sp. VF16]